MCIGRKENETKKIYHKAIFSSEGDYLLIIGLNGVLQIMETRTSKLIKEFDLNELEGEMGKGISIVDAIWWSRSSIAISTDVLFLFLFNFIFLVFNINPSSQFLERKLFHP